MSADTGHVAASPLCCRRLRTETRRAAACGARESRVGVRGDWLATSRIPDGDRARGGVWRKKIKGRRPRTLAGDVADSGRRQGARRLVAEKTSDTCRGDTGAAAVVAVGPGHKRGRKKEGSAVARLLDCGSAVISVGVAAAVCRLTRRDWVLCRNACRPGFFCSDFRMQGRN